MTIDTSAPVDDNRFFQTILNATLECLWVLSPEGTIRFANRTSLDIIGANEAEVQGQLFWETEWWSLSDDTRISVKTAVSEARTEIIRRELQLCKGEDGFIWVDFFIRPIFHSDEQLHFLLVEARDITLRKEAIERLKERELLLAEAQSLGKLGSWTWEAAKNEITWTEGLYRVFGFEDDLQPRTAEDYGPRVHPDDREPMGQSLQGVMHTDEPIQYSHRVVRPDGEIRHVQGVARRSTNEKGEVVRIFGMIQDITTQHLTQTQLARSVEQVAMVSRLAQTVMATLDKQKIYEQVVTSLRPLIGADVVVIFERDGNDLVVQLADADKEDADALIGVKIAIAETVAGRVWESGQPHLYQGDTTHQLVNPNIREALGYSPPSVISVPMRWQGERVGVLQAYHPEEYAFDDEDRNLLEIVAVWLAIALINAKLLEAQQAARRTAELQSDRLHQLTRRILSAQEDERRRIARELHDEAGQALAVLKMNLTLLRNGIQDTNVRNQLQEVLDLTGQTAKNIRHLAHNLRPPALDAFGLEHTLEELCRKFSEHTQIGLDYNASDLPTLSTDFNIVCYRFVQEALTNIAKHANASHVYVTIQSQDNMLLIEVRDNGQGFDVERAKLGIGFLGMTERLELLEGTLDVESTIGEGTRLIARIPIHQIKSSETTAQS
jgi:PAS domain S-box-containing protein